MRTPNTLCVRCPQPPVWIRPQSGFTLVELVAVIVILGVLAVFAVPRFTGGIAFRALAFHDDTVSALRFAQKSAVSHRRLVCAAFTNTTVQLTIVRTNPPSGSLTPPCGAGDVLTDPNGNANYAQSGDAVNVQFSLPPATIYFQPSGAVTSDAAGTTAIASASELAFINGTASNISVWGATGYVN